MGFWNKKIPSVEDKFVSCETCKHVVEESDAKKVKEEIISYPFISLDRYYCPEHAPKYEKKIHFGAGNTNYYATLKVNEEGIPIDHVCQEQNKKPAKS